MKSVASDEYIVINQKGVNGPNNNPNGLTAHESSRKIWLFGRWIMFIFFKIFLIAFNGWIYIGELCENRIFVINHSTTQAIPVLQWAHDSSKLQDT